MKIAIYVLTFLTYAYSGYGSSTLAHLRDAIIAAEAIFGDVFKNLITVVKKFRTVHEVFDAAVEEQCIFKCPVGPNNAAIGNNVIPYYIYLFRIYFYLFQRNTSVERCLLSTSFYSFVVASLS